MKIDIIIPNFNGLELLEKNLPLLLKKTEKNKGIHITVIDDCSTDSSVEFLKKNEPKIKVIRNEKNIGFAKSVNKAVSQSEGEIVILLNSDVYPKNDFIEPLISHFADPSVFAVGCLDKNLENGKEDFWYMLQEVWIKKIHFGLAEEAELLERAHGKNWVDLTQSMRLFIGKI